MSRWQGQSKGSPLGYRIFVWVCQNFGLRPAYLLLRIIAFYFFVFSRTSTRVIYQYFRKRHHFGILSSLLKTYRNNFLLGQTILDKIAVFAGLKNQFTFDFDGEENLLAMVAKGKGGILLSAHLGNWEMAGHHLKRINSIINIVMFDGEHEKIKKYLDSLGGKSFHVILIKEDMSHVYQMGAALAKNELICLHADRFMDGNKTMTMKLLGEEALFPAGPFQLASGFNVPVSIVFAFKETDRHYHYFGSPLFQRNEEEKKSDFALRLANEYVKEVENKIKTYPEQWFNYYDFWKK
jgi:predicted LPLAT superfamily acyltransferase